MIQFQLLFSIVRQHKGMADEPSGVYNIDSEHERIFAGKAHVPCFRNSVAYEYITETHPQLNCMGSPTKCLL